jgi:hypothetical protein
VSRFVPVVRYLVALLFMTAAAGAPAADRFVSSDGDDQDNNNDCLSSSAPCRTLQNAARFHAQLGDVVKVARATARYGDIFTNDQDIAVTISGGWSPDFTSRDPGPAGTAMANVFVQSNFGGSMVDIALDGITLGGVSVSQGLGSNAITLTDCRLYGVSAGVGNDAVLDIHLVDTTIARTRLHFGPGAINLSAGGTAVLTFTMTRSVVDKIGGRYGTAMVAEPVLGGGSLTLTIDDSVISRSSRRGLDIVGATLNITNSSIIGNRRGGLRLSGGAAATITNSVIARNRGSDDAPAIHLLDGTLDVVNSTIRKNRSICRLPACSGGIAMEAGSLALTNTILFDNVTPRGEAQDLVVAGGAASIDHSDVGDVSGSYSDGGGNVSVDPLCASRSDDHLTALSPVIDAGTCAGAPPTDFEGDARPTGAGCDIGADEFVP